MKRTVATRTAALLLAVPLSLTAACSGGGVDAEAPDVVGGDVEVDAPEGDVPDVDVEAETE